ncbi:hypothetical protein [Laceyella putida]|uniref:HK97 gp10 family phage protein n=1 Tax=Laceyella putida TaxID=110101 RepID=A0ABW2RRC5_9BACL
MARKVRQKFYIRETLDRFESHNKENVQNATTYLVEQIKRNLLRTSNQGGKNPSKPGELPHYGSKDLAKSIRGRTVKGGKTRRGITWTGYVTMGEEYGLILELYRNRSFMVRTMQEEKRAIYQNLTRRKR